MSDTVFAVIVTYFPDHRTEESIAALRPQVRHLVIVDNGSGPSSVATLRMLAAKYDFDLIANGRNEGIGRALNQGIAFGRASYPCDLVAFFDQDSLVSSDFVERMEQTFRSSAESVYLVVPSIVHRKTGEVFQHPTFDGRLLIGQTSGSVMPVEIFTREGLREDLFIEYVDYDFCLRMALLGRTITLCPAAQLYHEPGKMAAHSLFGRTFVTFNSAPVRKYYSMRNAIWIVRNYRESFPSLARFTLRNLLHEVVGVLLFEDQKIRKIGMWVCALRDIASSQLGEKRTS